MKHIVRLFLLAMSFVLIIGAQGFFEEAIDWIGWLSTIAVLTGAGTTFLVAIRLDKITD